MGKKGGERKVALAVSFDKEKYQGRRKEKRRKGGVEAKYLLLFSKKKG